MKSKNHRPYIFIYNYIYSPLVVLVMFWIFFFKGERFSIEKIINQRYEPSLYIAIGCAIGFLLIMRYNKKFPKK